MDAAFSDMLIEAERIRSKCQQTGNIGPHAACMSRMIRYGQTHGLFTGDVLAGTASEENLANAVEGAACILEVIHGETIGSVRELSRERQIELCRRAAEKAIAHLGGLSTQSR